MRGLASTQRLHRALLSANVLRRALLSTVVLLAAVILNASSALGQAARRISPSNGTFLDISARFDGKAVSCRMLQNGTFEAGFVTRRNRIRYWNDIDSLRAIRANSSRGRQLRAQRRTAQTACNRRASRVCSPIFNASTVTVLENEPTTFSLGVSNECDMPVTVLRVRDPSSGALEAVGGLEFTYLPANHYSGTDSARFAIITALGRIEQTVTFQINQLRSQFAGNPNSLLPYREQLTQEEVDSLLKRVGMGGTPALRSIRNLSNLVDALMSEQETPEAVAALAAAQASVEARVSQAPSGQSPRWSIWDVRPLMVSYLRYGQPLLNWAGTNFWMNHFVTDVSQQSNGWGHEEMIQHVDYLKRESFGSFDRMLHGMMGRSLIPSYLNGYDNTQVNPNQNLPREFLELFTAGVVDPISGEQNYNETDVAAMTRIFAGYYWYNEARGNRSVASGTLATPIFHYASDDDAPLPVTVDPNDCARQTANRIELRWYSANSGGQFMRIERAPLGSSTWTTLAEVSRWSGIFHDVRGCGQAVELQPAPGQVYQYRLRLVERTGGLPNGAIVRESAYSTTETGYFAGQNTPSIPANQTASTNLADRIRLTWGPVAGATSYRIYRVKYDAHFEDHVIADVPAPTTSFDDTDIYPNKTYVYYVRAYNSSTRLLSPNANRFISGRPLNFVAGYAPAPNQPLLPYPEVVSASSTLSDRVTITWTPVTGAAGYRILAKPAWVENPVRLADVPAGTTSYDDVTIIPGFIRGYIVVPFDNAGRLTGYTGQSTQNSERYMEITPILNGSGQRIRDDLLRPRTTFLEWLPDGDPNVGGRILGPDGDGDFMSIFGQEMFERINWQSVRRPTRSIIQHVLYQWPATSRNIAAKLFASIAHREISEPIVHELAMDLLASNYNLRTVMRKILMSSAAFAPEAHGTCVMNPTEALFTFLRVSELPITHINTRHTVYGAMAAANHDILTPPSVFGFPNCGLVRSGVVQNGSQWLASSQTYVSLGNSISTILQQVSWSGRENISLLNHFVPTGVTTPEGVVDALAAKLRITLNPEQRSVLIEYLNRNAADQVSLWTGALSVNERTQRIAGLVRLMVMSVNFLSK